jgi:DNA-binding NarL/FixJ family response regulator
MPFQKATIKVLLTDDHSLVREALGERLNREQHLNVVGTACDADEAIILTKAQAPDVVVMDIDMPGLLCFDAAKTILSMDSKTSIIFLSAFFNDRYIEQALAVKARGYITKREPPEVVVAAITEVAQGGVYFSDDVRDRLIVDGSGISLAGTDKTRASMLTPRELEVLRYIARGMTKKEIASTMHISVKTVENHSGSLMNKLDVHDRVALARYAIREGLAEA